MFSSVQRWGGGGFIQFSSVHGRRPQILLFKHLEINRPSRLGQPSPAMTGNGAGGPNFAPIDLKPRIWTFQTRCYRPPRCASSEKYQEQKAFFIFWIRSDFATPWSEWWFFPCKFFFSLFQCRTAPGPTNSRQTISHQSSPLFFINFLQKKCLMKVMAVPASYNDQKWPSKTERKNK